MTIGTEKAPHSRTLRLEPADDVRNDTGRLVAQSASPWLRLEFPHAVPAGRWIRLVCRSSFFDVATRPLLRFVTSGGTVDQAIPAASFGRTIWLGRVPDGTREILVSPVDEPGPFGFEIECCEPLSTLAVVRHALAGSPRRAGEAIAAGLVGRTGDMRRLLALAVGGTALDRYHEWRVARLRPFEPDGLDAPRSDWATGPHVRIVAAAARGDADRIRVLLGHLARQIYPRWSLVVVLPGSADAIALQTALAGHGPPGRLLVLDADQAIQVLCDGIAGDLLLGIVDPSGILPPHALAVLAEHAARRPDKNLFYTDEDSVDDAGRYRDPQLKPDWSPTFEARGGYVGPALFARDRCLAKLEPATLGELVREDGLGRLLSTAAPGDVEHVRQVLLTRRMASHPAQRRLAAPGAPVHHGGGKGEAGPCVTIVIPSKDQSDLLAACLRGLRAMTRPDDFEVIIIDNGSTEPATQALYDSLNGDRRIRVIGDAAPFNFAAMCNRGAAEGRAPLLLFLNNDIEMISDGWLQPLLSWASRPDIGAVGARLLYPSGRLQHGGVVLGLGGGTAHVDSGAPGDDFGYLDRRAVPHEVSAVTGACLAVEKRKFDAVGGFNAEELPVELNDIDLCLRLGARGWRTLFTPESVLIHRESASRGTSTAHSAKYERERAFFRRRWSGAMRNDPCFHPALSLASIRTALG